MSNLSVAQTSRFGLSAFTAPVTTPRFLMRSYFFFEVKKVMFMLPRSWYTVPPPLRRLATGIPVRLSSCTSHSCQGFWCLPITTAGAFLHNNNMLRLCTSTRSCIQSSRARFWKMSVDEDLRMRPALPLSSKHEFKVLSRRASRLRSRVLRNTRDKFTALKV
ncbi:hypothetical protein PGIGA_G00161310, partial [Pangasianodon gigas]|nr:hypothetical protein [Pangasianodon gigas]